MGTQAVKRVETSETISTLEAPELTAANALILAVGRWLDAECVGVWRVTTNVRILWREFCDWSGSYCTLTAFVAGLAARGFIVERGMVPGLALNGDFLYAIAREQEELHSYHPVQLKLID